MRQFAVVLVVLLCGTWAVGQSLSAAPAAETAYFQQALPAPPPPGAGGNVFFRTERLGDKMTVGTIAIADTGSTVTNAPYSAMSITETTQVLADGNRIVNKTEALVARDSQGRTRREEIMSNLGPLAANAPKMAFISDPVAKANYILDLNAKTVDSIKLPPLHGDGVAPDGAKIKVVEPDGAKIKIVRAKPGAAPMTVNIEKNITMGAVNGVEQRVWVNSEDASHVKTESLGTQTIEGVSAEGTRTTRTIPAGEIGNERAIEITSEVWTSPDLQMIVLSKRYDPRFGETVYKLTDIKRAEPDASLFQVPSGFTTRNMGD